MFHLGIRLDEKNKFKNVESVQCLLNYGLLVLIDNKLKAYERVNLS